MTSYFAPAPSLEPRVRPVPKAPAIRPQDALPLSPPVYHVLLALGEGVGHGYGIMHQFRDLTGGVEELLPGTLYATLSRMVEGGLLQEVPPPDPDADARRRYYAVTPWGRAVARAESERLDLLLDVARRRGMAPEGAR